MLDLDCVTEEQLTRLNTYIKDYQYWCKVRFHSYLSYAEHLSACRKSQRCTENCSSGLNSTGLSMQYRALGQKEQPITIQPAQVRDFSRKRGTLMARPTAKTLNIKYVLLTFVQSSFSEIHSFRCRKLMLARRPSQKFVF